MNKIPKFKRTCKFSSKQSINSLLHAMGSNVVKREQKQKKKNGKQNIALPKIKQNIKNHIKDT